MGKCREEFELFWTARCCVIGIECVLTRLINGDYYDIKAYYAWIGWKESRESMQAIKLPVLPITMPIDYRIGFSDAVNRCEDAITSAGYVVEE
jgi:hypothetical protein